MFSGAAVFNQPLERWDVSRVVSMRDMFRDALSFNQPLACWNTSAVRDFSRIFCGAVSFAQDLADWDLGSAGGNRQVRDFLTGAGAVSELDPVPPQGLAALRGESVFPGDQDAEP